MPSVSQTWCRVTCVQNPGGKDFPGSLISCREPTSHQETYRDSSKKNICLLFCFFLFCSAGGNTDISNICLNIWFRVWSAAVHVCLCLIGHKYRALVPFWNREARSRLGVSPPPCNQAEGAAAASTFETREDPSRRLIKTNWQRCRTRRCRWNNWSLKVSGRKATAASNKTMSRVMWIHLKWLFMWFMLIKGIVWHFGHICLFVFLLRSPQICQQSSLINMYLFFYLWMWYAQEFCLHKQKCLCVTINN